MSNPNIDRRAIFFWVSAVLALCMLPITPDDLRWVGKVLAMALFALGGLSFLDHAARRRIR